MKEMTDFSMLNANQLKAVKWDEGPLLVLAGPGSGKTRVLTSRIAWVLEQSQDQHFRILALTFTNKAAAEMRSRIEQLVPGERDRLRLTTFHSYAAELLRQHGSHVNFRPDFQILSNDIDRAALLDDVLVQLRKTSAYSLPGHFEATQLLPAITRLLDRCIPVDQVEALLEKSNYENAVPLARVYTAYRDALRRTNSLDFSSLIAETLDLLSNTPFLVKHIRKVYKHILVDEFQDTNSTQYQILSLITKPDPSTLFVVADDDQIIYQWNGASPKRISALQKDFHVSQLQLPENYRCPPQVIELANALIEKNLNRSAEKKPLKAIKKFQNNDVVRVCPPFSSIDEEVKWIAGDIAKKNTELRADCAVLARTRKLLDMVGSELEEAGIPVYYAARKDEFRSAPMRMLHAILRLANSKEDKQSLARLSKAFYEIEGISVELAPVLSSASADGKDLLRSWLDEVKRRDELEKQTRNLLEIDIKPFLNSLDYRIFSSKFFVWAESWQGPSRPNEDSFNEFGEERDVWGSLMTEITSKYEGEEVGLHQFLHELDLTSKAPPRPPEAIPCFTIHASKGMEFGHVYLMGLVEDQLPIWAACKKGDESLEMQEERRNCFVAITRAQESLTLTFSEKVFNWTKQPSRFLSEMGIKL